MITRLKIVGERPARRPDAGAAAAAVREPFPRPAVFVTSSDADASALRFGLALVRAVKGAGGTVSACVDARAVAARDALREAGAEPLIAWDGTAGAAELEARLGAAARAALTVCVGAALSRRFQGVLAVSIGGALPDADLQLASGAEGVASAIGHYWTRAAAAARPEARASSHPG